MLLADDYLSNDKSLTIKFYPVFIIYNNNKSTWNDFFFIVSQVQNIGDFNEEKVSLALRRISHFISQEILAISHKIPSSDWESRKIDKEKVKFSLRKIKLFAFVRRIKSELL